MSYYRDNPYGNQDAPLATELSTTNPVAAKDHPCIMCKQTITKGTKHVKYVFRDD
jgi:hypothetical protein